MKSKKSLFISIILLLSIFLSACSSTLYASTSWYGLIASPDNTTAYLAAGTQLYAVNISNGTEKWHYPQKIDTKINFFANPVLTPDGQQLLAPSYDHFLYSINTADGTGKVLFSGSSNRLIASPLVVGNVIYQPSSDHFIYAIDLNGTLIQKAETGAPIWASPVTDSTCNCIYVASMDHFIYKYNASDLSLIKKSGDFNGAIAGTPALGSDGTLYVGTFGKEIYAINSSDLSIKWRFATQDWVWGGPELVNDILYFGDLSGTFYALNAANGTKIWSYQANKPIVDTPVVSGDKIYFTTESDSLYILTTAGTLVIQKPVGGVIYSSPIVTNDTVLVAPTGFSSPLVALSLDGGTQKWMLTPTK